jgi:hypothetical protein
VDDELGFRFPKGVRILALPRPLAFADPNISYRSTYVRAGNTVTVRRRLRFRHSGIICSPNDYRRIQPALDRMMRDLRSQIIVQGA